MMSYASCVRVTTPLPTSLHLYLYLFSDIYTFFLSIYPLSQPNHQHTPTHSSQHALLVQRVNRCRRDLTGSVRRKRPLARCNGLCFHTPRVYRCCESRSWQ